MSSKKPTSAAILGGILFPDTAQIHDDLDRLFHVLHGYPFESRVKIVLTCEDIRRRQPHERKLGAVGAAPNRARLDVDPGTADRFTGVTRDLGVPIEDFLHVSVGLLDRHL